MSKTAKTSVFVLLFGLLLAGMLIVMTSDVHAGAKIVQVEGSEFNVQKRMSENIAKFKGKQIRVSLTSGEKIIGRVVAVNDKYLHLEKLDRMDFYDAFIKIDDVIAVKAKFRKYDNE